MRRDPEGYASLAALGGILLVCGLMAAWSGPYLARARRQDAVVARLAARRELDAAAAELLARLEEETGGEAERLLAFELPEGASLVDAQSRIPIHWARKYLLADTPLRGLFKKGSPDELQAYRGQAPLTERADHYAAFFDAEESSRLFSLCAPMNLNTVDEIAFENALGVALGAPGEAATLRARLRDGRASGSALRDADALRAWFGGAWDRVSGFVTAVPELNANTVDPFILASVVRAPALAVPDPASVAGVILDAREARYLKLADLRRITGLPENSALWLHLGDDSDTWELRLPGRTGGSISVTFRRGDGSGEGRRFVALSRRYDE